VFQLIKEFLALEGRVEGADKMTKRKNFTRRLSLTEQGGLSGRMNGAFGVDDVACSLLRAVQKIVL
jgi:hypothetical protein